MGNHSLGASVGRPSALAILRGGHTLLSDGHLLDDVSATLLHHLAADAACRTVVTVRTGEPAPTR